MAIDVLEPIVPERLYPLAVYRHQSGLSETRIREARRAGLILVTVDVGRRKFVRGVDGIHFIEQLAQVDSAQIGTGTEPNR